MPSNPENHVAYKVSASVTLVSDKDAGVLYAHYHTNWLFADNASISTTPDGLLSAVGATVQDRSPQILSNLEDTALDIGGLVAGGDLTGWRDWPCPNQFSPRE